MIESHQNAAPDSPSRRKSMDAGRQALDSSSPRSPRGSIDLPRGNADMQQRRNSLDMQRPPTANRGVYVSRIKALIYYCD